MINSPTPLLVRQTPIVPPGPGCLREAHESIPGYAAQERAYNAAQAAHRKAQEAFTEAAQQGRRAAVKKIADALVAHSKATATSPLNNLLEPARQQLKETQDLAEDLETLTAVHNLIGSELDTLIRNGADTIMRSLSEQLQDVYEESRKLGLNGIPDAEAALAAGKGAQWTRMIELRGTAYRIRVGQRSMYLHLYGVSDGPLSGTTSAPGFDYFQNYAELFPEWWESRQNPTANRPRPTPPWGTEPEEIHLWTVQHPEAEVWCPTVAEFNALEKPAKAKARSEAYDKMQAEIDGDPARKAAEQERQQRAARLEARTFGSR